MTKTAKDDADEGSDENSLPILSKSESQELITAFDKMQTSCKQQQHAVHACNDDESCARSSMDLTICMAQFVCPLQHAALLTTLENDAGKNDDEEMVESALLRMNECVMMKTKQYAQTTTTYPDLLQGKKAG